MIKSLCCIFVIHDFVLLNKSIRVFVHQFACFSLTGISSSNDCGLVVLREQLRMMTCTCHRSISDVETRMCKTLPADTDVELSWRRMIDQPPPYSLETSRLLDHFRHAPCSRFFVYLPLLFVSVCTRRALKRSEIH